MPTRSVNLDLGLLDQIPDDPVDLYFYLLLFRSHFLRGHPVHRFSW